LLCLHYSASGINIPLQTLGAAPEYEQWHSHSPVKKSDFEGIRYSVNAQLCFAALHLPEHDDGVAAAAELAYTRIDALRRKLGFEHMLRVWHYLYALNEGEGDEERYKQFCVGRARGLERSGIPTEQLPAATLVGSRAPGLRIHFILVKQAPINLENPRQTSAYHYPREYGPRQPAFARASIMPWRNAPPQLFVSGTASIVGHSSRHANDLNAQLDESLINIETLLESARETMGQLQWSDLDFLKIYLRRSADLEQAREHLQQKLGLALPLIFLHADLCRSELLVELETQST